jgi:hypothetical protein
MHHVESLASIIERSLKRRLIKSLFIILICLGVLLQMLGTPVSFAELNGTEDDCLSSLLMGVTVPSSEITLSPVYVSCPAPIPTIALPHHMDPYLLFDPPLLDL